MSSCIEGTASKDRIWERSVALDVCYLCLQGYDVDVMLIYPYSI